MFRFGFLAIAGVVSMYSCTDTWNDHYDAEPVLTGSGSTLETIQQNAPEFYNIIKATGYDNTLSNGNLYTIWAPKTIAPEDAEAIKALLADKQDSLVIQKYIKNHISRFTYSLGSSPVENITLLNTKRATMGTIASPTFLGKNIFVGESKACANGIVHFIDGVNEYVPNLYESMEERQGESEGMSVRKFLSKFNADTLIVDKSVAGGFNDKGEREYIDAFYRRNNTELNRIKGQIFAEDSSFIFILPSPKAYNERYEIARRHLVFNPYEDTMSDTGDYTDSLSRYYAGHFAMQDLIFSNVRNSKEAAKDSLVSVNYNPKNWEYHCYKNPMGEGGILAGLQGVECSNGTLYPVDEYPMSVEKQFFTPIKISPSKSNMDFTVQTGTTKAEFYASERANENPTIHNFTLTQNKITRNVEDGVATYDTIPGTKEITLNFLECSPTTSSAVPSYSFKIPNTLSANADEYQIKLVLVPEWLSRRNSRLTDADIRCASYFKAALYYKGTDNKYQSKSVSLEADEEHTEGSYIVSKPYNSDNVLLYTDTITLNVPIAEKLEDQLNPFQYAYYNRTEPGLIIRLTPNASSKQVSGDERTRTRKMLISKIILEPKVKPEN